MDLSYLARRDSKGNQIFNFFDVDVVPKSICGGDYQVSFDKGNSTSQRVGKRRVSGETLLIATTNSSEMLIMMLIMMMLIMMMLIRYLQQPHSANVCNPATSNSDACSNLGKLVN